MLVQVGGAQAIAAMAYGTATIPAADAVVGPGNKYVRLSVPTLSFPAKS
jgi:histidinol dehydrogenase